MTAILHEQQKYYCDRAPTFDDWWHCAGPYSFRDRLDWFKGISAIAEALDEECLGKRVIDYAAGTGWWTAFLARAAKYVIAVDGGGVCLEFNRMRNHMLSNISYRCEDLFGWLPPRTDVAFMCNWLSHVPDDRSMDWLQSRVSQIRPGGTLFVVEATRMAYPDRIMSGKNIETRESPAGMARVIKRPSLEVFGDICCLDLEELEEVDAGPYFLCVKGRVSK